MKTKVKSTNKGITLVALVITIIVLLILAGVAINMALDNDGLFAKANEAVTKWNLAIAEEERIMQNILEQMNEINGGGSSEGGTGNEGEGDGGENPPSDDPVTLPAGWDATKVAAVVEEGTRKAPIPVGYVASGITADANGKGAENTISSGLVIYQGTEAVTGTAGTTEHTTAMTTRNQFVWIPVDDINYMVMCKSNASGSVCNLELQTDGTLKCIVHDSTDLCGRVYETTSSNTTVDGNEIFTYTQTFDETQWSTQTYNANSGYREPAIVTGNSTGDGTSYDGVDTNLTGIGFSATEDLTVQQVFLNQLTSDFTAMATSVATYGGFYVSRYEVGVNGASLKNQVVLTAGAPLDEEDVTVYQGANKWYGLYNTIRSSSAIDKTAVNTHMIYGSQYDMIIKYLGENSANEPQIGHTSRQLTTQVLTGSTTTDIMSNIYDLEGNNLEWTAQAYYTNRRVIRGGYYYGADVGGFYPASYRLSNNPTNTSSNFSSRTSLYL